MNIMDQLAQARPASLDPRPDPARRASDLARAVATARPAAGPHRTRRVRRPAHPARRVRRPAHPARLIAIGTSVAAVAGAAGALAALSTTPAARPRPAAGPAVTAPGALRHAILTAFDGVSGDVFYTRITEVYSGAQARWNEVSENWSFPLAPQAGQDVRVRSLVLPASGKNKSDTEWLYTAPAGTQPGSHSVATTKTTKQ